MELLLKENLDLLSNNASSRTVNGVGSITLERAQGFLARWPFAPFLPSLRSGKRLSPFVLKSRSRTIHQASF